MSSLLQTINSTDSYTQTYVWNELGNLASQTYPTCNHCPVGTVPSRTVSYTYTQGFLTAVPNWATLITYHPNGSTACPKPRLRATMSADAVTNSSNDNRFRRDLPDALVLLRQARGLSQKELADRLGLDPSVLSRYEHGVSSPNADRLAALLNALMASWAELDVALGEVRRSRKDGEPPAPEAVLLGLDTTLEDATLALLAAVKEGRAEELVHRMIEQTRYVARLYYRLKTYEPVDETGEPDENGEDEPADDGDEGGGDEGGDPNPDDANGDEG